MTILAKLKEIEDAVEAYADAAGVEIEDVFEEIKTFLEGKTAEAEGNIAQETAQTAPPPQEPAANANTALPPGSHPPAAA